MEPEELQERLTKLLDQNSPENCMLTMPENLREAFDKFIVGYGKAKAPLADHCSVVAIMGGSFAEGFWLGLDYALEYGELRGD